MIQDSVAYAAVFETRLRWMSICWGQSGADKQHELLASCFDRATLGDAIQRIQHAVPELMVELCDGDEMPAAMQRLRERLEQYAEGRAVDGWALGDFSDVPLDLSERTDFQRRVLSQCQRIAPGETVSYGELAVRAGSPRAARAVGSVMSSNRLPLIVPCHRVVGSTGKLHGFSSPSGMKMKHRLLQMEREGADAVGYAMTDVS